MIVLQGLVIVALILVAFGEARIVKQDRRLLDLARDCLAAAAASTWRKADGSLVFARPQDYRPGFES